MAEQKQTQTLDMVEKNKLQLPKDVIKLLKACCLKPPDRQTKFNKLDDVLEYKNLAL